MSEQNKIISRRDPCWQELRAIEKRVAGRQLASYRPPLPKLHMGNDSRKEKRCRWPIGHAANLERRPWKPHVAQGIVENSKLVNPLIPNIKQQA